MTESARTYHQQLALHCLGNSSTPCTAAELLELMGTHAQYNGHPPRCWKELTTAKVQAVLGPLVKDNVVVQSQRYLPRHSRQSPQYETVKTGPNFPPPENPDSTATGHVVHAVPRPVVGGHDSNPYAGLTREQMYALLEIHDSMAGATSRFLRELEELTSRARMQLASVGLGKS